MLGPTSAVQVMDTILQDCVKLNSKRAKLGGNSGIFVKVRQHNNEIREYAEEIAVSKFGQAVKKVNDEDGHLVCKNFQVRYNQSIYWDIIQSHAESVDPMNLQARKGPSDGSEKAEKEAAKELSIALGGIGLSPPSQQKYRRLWKNLAKWRKSGVDMILLYRTTHFDNFCEKYPGAASSMPSTQGYRRFWTRFSKH